MDENWFKVRGLFTIADIQRHDNAVARATRQAPKRVTQVRDDVRGYLSPLLEPARGNGDYRSMWKVPPK